MTRERRLTIILVLGLLLIGSAWLLPRLEWIEVEVPGRQSGEARRNSSLAARRMISALGYRTRTIHDATELARLPLNATLWLNQTLPDPAAGRASDQIAAWVKAGGHAVIAVPADWQPRRLAEAFGVRALGLHSTKHGALLQFEGRKLQVSLRQCDVFTAPHPVVWSASVHGYRPIHRGTEDDDDSRAKPAKDVAADATAVARFRVGAGMLTVLCDDRPMLNEALGQGDNARFTAALLLEGARDEVIFATQPEYPSLPAWLWQHASSLLATVAALIALLLWRASVRFGALQAVPPAARPGMRTHLEALAAFLLRQQEFDGLLRGPREEARHLLARLPGDAANQIDEAARRSGLDAHAVRTALENRPRDAHQYQRQAQTLSRLIDRLRTAHQSPARRNP
ncbi:hypothetical protein OPU71_01265 [Niveibacterium sp. 24ML]|uniref:DUF4350 domain-containing protein n=1 Tax=Niveibacterium sp. 24ML TaxID=2985512 RepID=UPI00226F9B24|nr:DUF4350 domain-containing protein [Niveibacterium sp. 24ML]MCX9154749.1 hypothetical protein [Niveibacterium sp. 24ML]